MITLAMYFYYHDLQLIKFFDAYASHAICQLPYCGLNHDLRYLYTTIYTVHAMQYFIPHDG